MDISLWKRGAALAGAAALTAGLLLATVAPAAIATPGQKNLPKMTIVIPRDVLVFPASVSTGSTPDSGQPTPTIKQAQELVTEAFRAKLSQAGIGAVVYNKRLPSIQRSVAEGAIKADQAAAGPGDDPRSALQLASLVGAAEYITIEVQGYKYDQSTRTVTFNVSVERNSAEDNGGALATVAKPAQGAAPSDVSPVRQEASAVAHAADQVADEVFQDLYPQVAQLQSASQMKAVKPVKPAKKK